MGNGPYLRNVQQQLRAVWNIGHTVPPSMQNKAPQKRSVPSKGDDMTDDLQMRWILPEGTTCLPPILQYRVRLRDGDPWTPWRNVPLAVVSNDEWGQANAGGKP